MNCLFRYGYNLVLHFCGLCIIFIKTKVDHIVFASGNLSVLYIYFCEFPFLVGIDFCTRTDYSI